MTYQSTTHIPFRKETESGGYLTYLCYQHRPIDHRTLTKKETHGLHDTL